MEDVLLGYNPSAVLSNCPSRNSCDVDFSDVFGGPPRRSSTSFDSHSVDGNHEVADEGCSSWIMTREKPVFGEASTGVRRRYTSDDFFDDIFRGDQQTLGSSQSPRVVRQRSPFSSAPGSRVMSPSRFLPPEPFALPAKFSLPSRATTNTDFTASTSKNQSSFSPSLSRFNQPIQNHDGSYHSSSQSNAFPPSESTDLKESTSGSQIDGFANQSDIHDTAKISDFPIYASNFHFSIYKWASKGVPLVISFRKKSPGSKEETKLNRSGSEEAVEVDKLFSENHMVDIPVPEVLPSEKTTRPAPTLKERQQHNDSFEPTMTTAKAKPKGDDNALAEPSPYGSTSPSNVVDKNRKEVSSRGLEETSNNLPKQLPKKSSNTRPLSSFVNANYEGIETLIAQNTRDKMRKVKEKEKSSPGDDFSSHKVHKTEGHKSSSPATEKDYRNSEATAKVKDFVKIFNQESSSKAWGPSLRQSHSRRWKDTKTIDVDYEIRFSSARIDDEMEASYVNWGEAWPDTSEMEDETSTGSHRFNMNDAGCVPETAGQTSANETKASLMDSAPINNAGSEDDLRSYETKVSKWSKGKEGNIRALLSTLQYVSPKTCIQKQSNSRSFSISHNIRLVSKATSTYELWQGKWLDIRSLLLYRKHKS